MRRRPDPAVEASSSLPDGLAPPLESAERPGASWTLLRRLPVGRLHAVFSLVVAVAALVFVYQRLDFAQTWKLLAEGRVVFLGLGFLGFYLSLPLRAYRWQILLSSIGYEIPLRDLTSVIFKGWFCNSAVPGRLGDLYAAYLMKEQHGTSIARVGGTIFLSRMLDFGTLIFLLAGLFILGFRDRVPREVGIAVYTGMALAIVMVLLVATNHRVRPRILHLLPERLGGYYEAFSHASVSPLRRGPLLGALTLLLWIVEGWRLGCVLATLGVSVPLTTIMFLALMAAILTTLPITPGGLGTVELFYQQTFPLLGIEPAVSGSAIFLDRFINYWFILVAGALILMWLRLRRRFSQGA